MLIFLHIGQSSTPQADQSQLTDECIVSILSCSAHGLVKFAFSCSQCSQTTEVPMVWTVMSWSRDNLVYVPTGCLHAAWYATFGVLASHMLLSSESVWLHAVQFATKRY